MHVSNKSPVLFCKPCDFPTTHRYTRMWGAGQASENIVGHYFRCNVCDTERLYGNHTSPYPISEHEKKIEVLERGAFT